MAQGMDRPVVTLVTQVVVDKDDPGFQTDKPIGLFIPPTRPENWKRRRVISRKDSAGLEKGVTSPEPVEIVELPAVKALVEAGVVVIAAGGGGIPVIRKADGSLEGVAAVIDKDYASERLAEDIDADGLVILTAVEKVSINFGRPDQRDLDVLTVKEARKHIEEGYFAPGSMLPKVKAAMAFAQSKKGRKAIISSLEKALEALEGKTGTLITQ